MSDQARRDSILGFMPADYKSKVDCHKDQYYHRINIIRGFQSLPGVFAFPGMVSARKTAIL